LLLENAAIDIIAASTRGNRRVLINTASIVFKKAYYDQQKKHHRQDPLQMAAMVQPILVSSHPKIALLLAMVISSKTQAKNETYRFHLASTLPIGT
jgi:hypothetical protein